MKCISVRQPWAWLIMNAGKDIENRSWPTGVRGRVLIHAAKGMTHDEYDDVRRYIHSIGLSQLPDFDSLTRGCIIGSVEITDSITDSRSKWFFGPHGFVLKEPRACRPIPWRGALGFFEVPDSEVPEGMT